MQPDFDTIANIWLSAWKILECRKKYMGEMESKKDGKMDSGKKLSIFPSDQLFISLADLYDPLEMPKDLREAHKKTTIWLWIFTALTAI